MRLLSILLFAAATLRAQIPAPRDPLELGIFGIGSCHINNRNAEDNARWLPQMKAAGLRYYRTAHTAWGSVEPQITDFGLARRMDTDSGLTVSGSIMGTPHYMAPEQARGENREVGPATDVYSLGAVLYELLSGRRPFVTDELLELLQQVKDTPPPDLSRLVPRLDRDLGTIVMKCLEKSPAARYPTAEALADELERWLHGEPIHARPASRAERLVKWARRRPMHATAAALGVVAVAATGIAGALLARRQLSGITPEPGPVLHAGGHRYQLMSGALPWEEAKEAAEKTGGHLAVISSEEEALRLLNSPLLAGVSPDDWCLLGATLDGGVWKSVTGEPVAPVSATPTSASNPVRAVLSPSGAGVAATAAGAGEWLRRCHGFIVEWDEGEADPPPAALPGAGPDGWVDLMSGQSRVTAVRGNWFPAAEGGMAIDLDKLKRPPLLQFDLPLPDEFDYQIEFAANSDTTVELCMVFPTALPGQTLTARLSGFGSGFGHTFDGSDALRSPVRSDDEAVIRNTLIRCRVEVRRTSLRLLLDDEVAVAWTGAFHRLAGHPELVPPAARCPGIACMRTAAVVRRASVRAAPGPAPAGAFLRRVPLGDPDSPARILTSPDWSWSAPVSAGPGVNSNSREISVSLSADELILILGSEREGSQDLFECRRASRDEPFGPATLIRELSRPVSHESGGSLTPDGLTLVYGATAGPGQNGDQADLYISRRASRDAPWAPPQPFDETVNSTSFETDPWLSPDANTIIFTSGRRNDESGSLWLSRRASNDVPFPEAVRLSGVVDTAAGEGSAKVCADGHTLLYFRTTNEAKALYAARLDGTTATSQRRLDLPPAFQFRSAWLAPDGRTLYAAGEFPDRPADKDIWILKRQPGKASPDAAGIFPGTALPDAPRRAIPAPASAKSEPQAPPPITDSEPWTLGGSRYQIIAAEAITWPDAKARAEKLGGHLAVVTSMEESISIWEHALARVKAGGTLGQIWIGGSRGAGQADWHWVTGEPFEFHAFTHPPKSAKRGAWTSILTGENDRLTAWNEFTNDSLSAQNHTYQIRGFCVEWKTPDQ